MTVSTEKEIADALISLPCVQCGYCCAQGACVYGDWDAKKKQCEWLTDKNLCALHDAIADEEKDSKHPMFGGYCSSPLCNSRRMQKINQMAEGGNGVAGGSPPTHRGSQFSPTGDHATRASDDCPPPPPPLKVIP